MALYRISCRDSPGHEVGGGWEDEERKDSSGKASAEQSRSKEDVSASGAVSRPVRAQPFCGASRLRPAGSSRSRR